MSTVRSCLKPLYGHRELPNFFGAFWLSRWIGSDRQGALIVTCPHTQQKLSTGIRIDKDSFSLVEFNALVVAYCPHCEQEHSWRYRDAEYVVSRQTIFEKVSMPSQKSLN
jgi:hypothetical protein